jgi:hypothetical protein
MASPPPPPCMSCYPSTRHNVSLSAERKTYMRDICIFQITKYISLGQALYILFCGATEEI